MTDHGLYGRAFVDGAVQHPANLNEATIAVDHWQEPIAGHRQNQSSGNVECLFLDLEAALVERINRYPMVVGCVAWLTNEAVLKALAQRSRVQIIVQKEDFLRPDSGGWSQAKLRSLYEAFPMQVRWAYNLNYNVCGDDRMGAIRCAGICEERSKIPPRMHHKFLVFCDVQEEGDGPVATPIPRAVWTGSFNMTQNATRSLENAVVIYDETIARAYYNEWRTVLGLSEPLDWRLPYIAPEYRIGT